MKFDTMKLMQVYEEVLKENPKTREQGYIWLYLAKVLRKMGFKLFIDIEPSMPSPDSIFTIRRKILNGKSKSEEEIEIINQKRKEYHHKNKERINARTREYGSRPEIKVRTKERKKEYESRPEVKERTRIRKKKYWQVQEVKDKKNVERKLRYYDDKEYNIKHRSKSLLRSAFKQYSKTGKIKASCKYGIDYKAIIKHLKPFPEDIENYHIDHIIPLSRFDFNNHEQIKKAFAPTNHQWLTIKENLEKGNKLIMPH